MLNTFVCQFIDAFVKSFQCGPNATEVSLKRYRYSGKERDEGTGFYYHGARYYIPWLARWCASDPLQGKNVPQSSYIYCSDNPIMRVDEDGMQDKNKHHSAHSSSSETLSPTTRDQELKTFRKGAQEAGKDLSNLEVKEGGKLIEKGAVKQAEKTFFEKGFSLFGKILGKTPVIRDVP